ncbi:hypothetical protein [Amycolatopsis sp. PS_44_ISF1]|uniref:hypothetical protein n=1 Tax=Amycolatopsis sp. PS_44_ISF1 TaxID=2974917 RepID=UPI0028DF7701|nr:hypothetical protein [Amycolatopsis sp. PS_44_ISF1]MDT8909603.1 hypothetical protein [Amycolatopsis sp. PS_44_ISF1]
MRPTLRSVRVVAVLALPAAWLLAGSSVAFADDGVARAETAPTDFGMLGPVGLVAVALGIVGMTFGVVRQRRKARAAAAAAPVVQPRTEGEEPTRPLAPLRRP